MCIRDSFCALLYASVHSCPVVCTPVRFCALLHTSVHSCTLLCTRVHFYKGCPTPLIGDKHATRPHAIQPRARIGGDSGPRLHCIRSSGMFIPRHGVCAALCFCIWTATQPLDTESWHHFCALLYTSVHSGTLLCTPVNVCALLYTSVHSCTLLQRVPHTPYRR